MLVFIIFTLVCFGSIEKPFIVKKISVAVLHTVVQAFFENSTDSFCNPLPAAAAAAQDDEISSYPQGLVLVARGADENSIVLGPHIRGSRLRAASAAGDEEVDLLLPGTARLQIQLGVNMPARAEHCPSEEKNGELFHEVYDVVLYLGIIDILQVYNMSKKIEHTYKSIHFDSFSISAVNPMLYSQRFLQFIRKVFPRNP